MIKKRLSEVQKLRIEMNSRFYDVEEKILDLKSDTKKIDRVLEQLDSVVGQFRKFDEEQEMMSDKIREHNDQIDTLLDEIVCSLTTSVSPLSLQKFG